ncbi:two-component system, NarL family, sensor histidine kinase DesK [Nonomuraea solani]|uniref:Two-component system, NarL family, sensor histidine kinase DesK n=1 Tax=Nonomuraea solani TaxID=1144553 RepID=A0A1H6EW33_9ACTN|nr:histidine kinase [Nonomuraea solani]SEH02048.1 two-component system, NarL family, sensor histidine kinase DesK [Nonomuraea solani]
MAQDSEAQVRWLTTAVVAATGALWGLTPLAFLITGDLFRALLAVVLLGGLLVVYARIVARHIAGTSQGPHRARTFLLFAVVVYGAIPFQGSVWVYTPLIVATAGLLLLPFRYGIGVLLVVAAAEYPLTFASPIAVPPLERSAGVLVAAVVAAGIVHYARFVRELRELRVALAEMAVDQDRLRLAGQLHDLLGQTLTSITLKTELALALVGVDRKRAAEELEGTIAIAVEARDEIGDVVAAKRSLNLGAELSAAVALIELTGADCDLRLGFKEIDEEIGDALGWMVREAATNIVRHSDARRCLIDLDKLDGRIRLLVRNDGARPETGSRSGSGLAGLRRRVERLGGSLEAEATGECGFEVRVWLPAVHDRESGHG